MLIIQIFFNDSLLTIIVVYRHQHNILFSKNIANSLFFYQFSKFCSSPWRFQRSPLSDSPRTNSTGSLLADLTLTIFLVLILIPLQSFSIILLGPLPLLISCFLPQIFHRFATCPSGMTHGAAITSLFLSISTCKLNLFTSSLIKFAVREQWLCVHHWLAEHSREIADETSAIGLSVSPEKEYNIHLPHFGKHFGNLYFFSDITHESSDLLLSFTWLINSENSTQDNEILKWMNNCALIISVFKRFLLSFQMYFILLNIRSTWALFDGIINICWIIFSKFGEFEDRK